MRFSIIHFECLAGRVSRVKLNTGQVFATCAVSKSSQARGHQIAVDVIEKAFALEGARENVVKISTLCNSVQFSYK